MRERVEEMAVAMTLEQGKPIAQSRLEILRACEIIEWDAQEGRRIYGRIIPSEPGMRHTVLRQPIGVVAAFSPWNFPISSPARKVGGALSAGCSIILKASEETPAGAVQLVAGLRTMPACPPGVLNLVFGKPSEISEYLIPQPSVRLVTFTGSVPVGKHLTAHGRRAHEAGDHGAGRPLAGDRLRRRRPGRRAARTPPSAKSRNAGQVCVSPTRFFVQDAIYDRFTEAFAREGRGAEGRQRPRSRQRRWARSPTTAAGGDGDAGRRRQGQGRARA